MLELIQQIISLAESKGIVYIISKEGEDYNIVLKLEKNGNQESVVTKL